MGSLLKNRIRVRDVYLKNFLEIKIDASKMNQDFIKLSNQDGNQSDNKNDTFESSLDWIPVDSDGECIPRRRKVSTSSSSSSEGTSSEFSTSNCETNNRYSSTSDLDSSFLKYEKQSSSQDETAASTAIPGSGEGKVRGWQKEPLSIMWCLNSFDSESSSQSRNVLYDQKTQTVMAVENTGQSSGAGNSHQSTSNTKVKKKKKKRKVARKREDSSCHSCDSIDSSPTHYKDDVQWTGYKIKKRIQH